MVVTQANRLGTRNNTDTNHLATVIALSHRNGKNNNSATNPRNKQIPAIEESKRKPALKAVMTSPTEVVLFICELKWAMKNNLKAIKHETNRSHVAKSFALSSQNRCHRSRRCCAISSHQLACRTRCDVGSQSH